VKELRRVGASSLEDANAALTAYLPRYNQRFAVAPMDATSAYQRLSRDVDLAGVCSFHYRRTVANDNTVRLDERLVQIPPGPQRRSYARCAVHLEEHPDGRLVVVYQGQRIARQEPTVATTVRARGRRATDRLGGNYLPAPPARAHRHANPRTPVPTPPCNPPKRSNKPPANHPWREPRLEPVTKSLAR
jgi:hypothetical protein